MRQTVNVRGLHVRMATGAEFVEAQIIDQNHDQVGAHCHGSSLTVALDKRRQVECNDSSLLACLRRAQHPEVERLQAIEHNAGRGTAQTSRIYTETSAVSPSIWRSRGDLSSAAEITDPLLHLQASYG